jgi:hypothetical protein
MDDFNWLIYINKYDDLKNNGINIKEKALNHYINYGINEGRNCTLNCFESKIYLEFNEDLKIKYEKDKNYEDLFFHWINFGMYESRISIDNYFDWEFYIEKNEQLKNENIDTEEKALNHYFYIGKNDDRFFKNEYQIYKYKSFSFIKDYIDIYAKQSRIFNDKKNYIDIDLFFYKFVNDIELYSKDDLLNHFHNNGYKGLIYHPRQLLNIFSNIVLCKNFYS